MGNMWSQIFPPKATFTTAEVTSQAGRVFLVTGGTSGVGLELSRILYHAGGHVYITARSSESAERAIADLKSTPPCNPCLSAASSRNPGRISYLVLRLDDLTTIHSAAESFLSKEKHLHVLFNNAGVSLMTSPTSLTPQGHELHLATNCLGPYLLTTLLLPALQSAAAISPAHTVRIIWAASIVVDTAPQGGFNPSIDLPPNAPPLLKTEMNANYTLSKVGNWFLASEMARRYGNHGGSGGANSQHMDATASTNQNGNKTGSSGSSSSSDGGIISLAINPGNLYTNLLRTTSPWIVFLVRPLLYAPRFGAYSYLWTGLGDEVTALAEQSTQNLVQKDSNTSHGGGGGSSATFWNGGYALAWGRMHPTPRTDLLEALGRTSNGDVIQNKDGASAGEFWNWCEERVKEFR